MKMPVGMEKAMHSPDNGPRIIEMLQYVVTQDRVERLRRPRQRVLNRSDDNLVVSALGDARKMFVEFNASQDRGAPSAQSKRARPFGATYVKHPTKRPGKAVEQEISCIPAVGVGAVAL
jgi:hypothetical protein